MCPILKGAGLATVVISFWLCTYYNVIIAWAMTYLIASFSDPLPWASCNSDFNTPNCWDIGSNHSEAEKPESAVPSTVEFYKCVIIDLFKCECPAKFELFQPLCLGHL